MCKTILIVDDDKDILSVLEKRLDMAGFDVMSASNGQRGITIAKTEHPDLIILDVQMPNMDGGEVAQRLRADAVTENIPILFLTCLLSRQESNQMRYDSAGNLMVSKSIEPAELISLITKVYG